MKKLLFKSLLLVGEKKEKETLKNFFQEIDLAKNNKEALTIYSEKNYTLLLLICNKNQSSNNIFTIVNEIHQHNRYAHIALYSPQLSEKELIKLIPLKIIGFLSKPLVEEEIQNLIKNLDKELILSSEEILLLNNGYYYDTKESTLYSEKNQKIKLTKNQRLLMELLAQAKYQFISTEAIEHKIWEDSFESNCIPRLKNLIYNLRKKLPKNTLINNYSLGYKLGCL